MPQYRNGDRVYSIPPNRKWIAFLIISSAMWPFVSWLGFREVLTDDVPNTIVIITLMGVVVLVMLSVSAAGIWLVQLVIRTTFSECAVCQPRLLGLRGTRCIRWKDVIRLEVHKGGEGVRLCSSTDKIEIYTMLYDRQVTDVLVEYLPLNLPIRWVWI